MEWIETTGRSVEEAKEAALDELGVDEADAEFHVLAEAQTGLFGRLRAEARVRARVRPTAPRSKEDRRDRRRRSSPAGGSSARSGAGASSARGSGAEGSGAAGSGAAGSGAAGSAARSGSGQPGGAGSAAGGSDTGGSPAAPYGSASAGRPETSEGPRRRRRRGGGRGGGQAGSSAPAATSSSLDVSVEPRRATAEKGDDVTEVALERQGDVATEFLSGLATEFGLKATATVTQPDDETVEIRLDGPDLGILIGPKGATLVALQNLTRTVVFNKTGANNGHVNVDVAGYRQKRSEALARFATQVANTVKQNGERAALEPMSAVDRKVVHDTIASIEGVSTVSEGEEPRRRVVVLPG